MSQDALLIEQTIAGDSMAFGQLVQKYQNRLFNTMVHFIGSREEAEDVVQDAFVQAFIKLSSFRGTSAFYTWLYRIAYNVSVSRQRRMRPEISMDQIRAVTGNEPVAACEMPPAQMERKERIALVQAALRELNEEHRAILILREMEGCSYESIADMLDLPVGTVRSRLHRARLQMREQLKAVLQQP